MRRKSEDLRQDALTMLREPGATVRAVAETLGVGKSTVHEWARMAEEANSPGSPVTDIVLDPGPDGATMRAPELLHTGPRATEHVHDPDSDDACVIFDLHGTMTRTRGFPLVFEPYAGLKEGMDRLKARGVCFHIETAGLDDVDPMVNSAAMEIIEGWLDYYALPVDFIGPKMDADVFYNDRLVECHSRDDAGNEVTPDYENDLWPKIEADLSSRFELVNGIYRRIPSDKEGRELDPEEFPELTPNLYDRPRGFTTPTFQTDIHRCITFAAGSERTAAVKPNAKEIVNLIYHAGYTVTIGCAGWNPATHSREDWEKRYAYQGYYLYENGVAFDRRVSRDHGDVVVEDKGIRHSGDWMADWPRIYAALHRPHMGHNIPLGFTESEERLWSFASKTDQSGDSQARKRRETTPVRRGTPPSSLSRSGAAIQANPGPGGTSEPQQQTAIVRKQVQSATTKDVGEVAAPGTGLETGVDTRSVSTATSGRGSQPEPGTGLAPDDLAYHDHPVLNRLYLEAMFRFTRLMQNGVAHHHAIAAVQKIDPDFYIEESQSAWLLNALAHRGSGKYTLPNDPRVGQRSDHPDDGMPTLYKMSDQDAQGLANALVRFEISGQKLPQVLLMGWSADSGVPPQYVLNTYDRYLMTAQQEADLSSYLAGMMEDAYLLGINQQLVANGFPHVSDITDPAVLGDIKQNAAEVASGIADTYNRELANRTYGTWITQRSTGMPGSSATPQNLNDSINFWAEQRAEAKAEQVAITESNRAFNNAVQDYLTNNPEATQGATARVTPDDCVCAGCQALVDAGEMSIEEALSLQLPLHPGCVHEITITYPTSWSQVGDVGWNAQAQSA